LTRPGCLAALALLLFATATARAAPAQEAAAPPSPVETQAAAAQKEAQDAEAQVLELRRELQELENARASNDDLRRRLDQLEDRQAQAEREATAAREQQPPETSVVRFKDDGFEIRSPDNGFYLRPRLRVQGIYTGTLATRGAMDLAPPDQSGFSLGRAEMVLDGHVGGPFFQYRLQLDAAQANPLKDAYVTWQPRRVIAVQAGQFKVPFGLQRQYWRAELEFIDISAPTAAFSLERDLGVEAVVRPLPGRLSIRAGLLNGAGANRPNDNFDLAYAVRLRATPFGPMPVGEGDVDGSQRPRLSLGASGYYTLSPTDVRVRTANPTANVDRDGDGRVDNVAVWQGGVDLRAVWRGAALQAEWFGRLEDPGIAAASRRFWGGYVEASVFVLPRVLQLAGRVGHTDLPLYGATAQQHFLAGTYQNEQAGAVSAYIRGHRVKAQVDYTHLTSDGQTAPSAHRVRAALQVGF